MKSKMFKKLMAASLATVMTVSLAGCGEKAPADASTTPADDSAATTSEAAPTDGGESTDVVVEPEDPGMATVLIDPATGAAYDLGGMEIIIRDWWSPEEPAEPQNEYEEARAEYREWIQETYNFKIKEVAMGDWGSNPQDFVDYVTTGGDEFNYVFTLRADPAITSAMSKGLMYDIASLDCIDLSESKWQKNKLHEQYTYGDKVNCINAGYPEPRCGVYFNKRLLEEAGIDPESIYDMQADGTWTWQAWADLMAKVQRDINNDGVIDVYGFDANYGIPVSASVASNYSEYVGLEDGKFVYKFEDAATVEALEWIVEMFKNYALVRPEDAQWDYYKEAFKNGQCAFMPDEAYCGGPNGFLMDMVDEIGFVAFPKGPQATDYTNWWTDNAKAIPGCYDADRAWKIAFAYNLWTEDTPGYPDYMDLGPYRNYNFDSRAVDETIVMMTNKGSVTYHSSIPDLDMGAPFLYNFGSWTVVSEVLDGVRDSYKAYIDAANQ
jgi:ABC-type glycerol-3-phosphate transport system substrate-binding protein